jgi:hypothetical protein
VKAAGIIAALVLAVFGFVIAFGAWSVGYCGSLTPDVAPPATVRHDLCRGTSGDLMSGAVFVSWLVAAAAPLLGTRWALAKNAAWPLTLTTALGAAPIVVILVLAEVLPQS